MNSLLDRTIAPSISIPENIKFLEPRKESLGRNSFLHLLEGAGNEVLKIEWVFNAGSRNHVNSLIPLAANELIHRGTSDKTAGQIAEQIDYCGAFFEHEVTKDWASLTLYCLVKHQETLIPLVSNILHSASYPQKEYETFVDSKRQNFRINQEKVSHLARNEFNNYLFGEQHPYNSHLTASSFETISKEDVLAFYDSYYKNGEMEVFVSGDFDANTIQMIQNEFGDRDKALTKTDEGIASFVVKPGVYHIEKKGAIQTAIRVGMNGLGRNHSDYSKFRIANTMLGGYFGSRLMANLREDKGYTYGVSSALIPFKKEGVFVIVTEVNAEYANKAVNEIKHELRKLSEEIPSAEELDIVRNYMMGSILKHLDGVFSQMEAFKEVYVHNLDYSFYRQYLESIKSITPEEITEIAGKYMSWEEMIVLTAGTF